MTIPNLLNTGSIIRSSLAILKNTCNITHNNEYRTVIQNFFLSAALRYLLTLFFGYPWHTKSVVTVFVGALAGCPWVSLSHAPIRSLVYSLIHMPPNACICITDCASHSQSWILYLSCLTDFLRVNFNTTIFSKRPLPLVNVSSSGSRSFSGRLNLNFFLFYLYFFTLNSKGIF